MIQDKLSGNDLACPNCYSVQLIRSGWEHGKQRYRCKKCGHRSVYPVSDVELLRENVKYRKEKQKAQDVNRVERKAFREHARINNALSEYNKELIKILKEFPIKRYKPIDTRGSKGVGLIQLSDLHFNELVSMESNKYDFDVASKRLRTFIRKAKK